MCLRGPRQLTQFNIGKLIRSIDNPRLDNYIAEREEVNKVAEHADGFIWKYKTQLGIGTEIFVVNDPRIVANLTVSQSLSSRRISSQKHCK